jgi:tRNA (guanine26-N2/guanine27-N2)-dimethyltransferase
MFQKITEGPITITAPVEEKVSKELPVFYNPAMKFNRDSSILLLKAVDDKDMMVCDLLAGTGIRAIRFLAELPKGKIESITINDLSPEATKLIKKNIVANKKLLDKTVSKKTRVKVTTKDASILLLESTGFDYIDIDPFGTPNPFLDSAIRRLARDGILAVTATDTSSLAGTYPLVCQRRYWATPDSGPLKHESGLRILIRKVQLVAAQYEKALTPIFSYAKEHYMRVFFKCEKSKSKSDEILKLHGMLRCGEVCCRPFAERVTENESSSTGGSPLRGCRASNNTETERSLAATARSASFSAAPDDGCVGPMWLGPLCDQDVVEKMYSLAAQLKYDFDGRFLQLIRDENKLNIVGFFDIHDLCNKHTIQVPAFEGIFEEIAKRRCVAARTHFSEYGIRSDIQEVVLVRILKSLAKN